MAIPTCVIMAIHYRVYDWVATHFTGFCSFIKIIRKTRFCHRMHDLWAKELRPFLKKQKVTLL